MNQFSNGLGLIVEMVTANADQMIQIFQNLLDNMPVYTPLEGILV
ncbi:MAG: hypothetical protein ACE5FZ_07475 [Nitrospiria bacterium]